MNNTERQKHIKKAKKLLSLAERETNNENEAKNAREKLEKHLLKHGISIEEVDEKLTIRSFPVRTKDEYTILTNVILSVNPYCKIHSDKGIVKADLDQEDYEEVVNKFKYFMDLWLLEMDFLQLSFFTKNQKFLRPDQYAYDKHCDNGKTEHEALVISKEEEIKMNAPKQENVEESPKQKRDRINLARMHGALPFMLNATYERKSTKV